MLNQSRESFQFVSNFTDSILISYSGGKDSIVILDLASKYFKRIVCFHLYIIKNTDYNKADLLYPIRKYKAELLYYPHPDLIAYFNAGYYTPEKQPLPEYKQSDIWKAVKYDTGIKWMAIGFKQIDSFMRMTYLRKLHIHKTVDLSSRNIFPLSRWTNKQVRDYVKLNNLLKSHKIDSDKLRSDGGIGLSHESIITIYKKYRSDYEKVKKIFPLVEAIIERERYKGTL